jgi:TPR repeat protein
MVNLPGFFVLIKNAAKFHSGIGADHHAETAVYWLKQASDQGHAKAQYNLAISHLRGFNTGLQPGYCILRIESFNL